MRSSKQITGNKQISKWMRRECNYHAHFTSRTAGKKVDILEKELTNKA